MDDLDLEVEAGSFFGFLGAEELLAWSIVRGLPPVSTIATGLLVLATTSVLLSLLGNFTSVAFPESRPVSALTSAASPTGTLVMIGGLLVGAAAGGVIFFGAAAMTMPVLQPILALAFFSTVTAVYHMSLSPAAHVFSEHRGRVFRALSVN